MTGFGVGLVATLAWGALAFGAVYPWAYWPLAMASAALGIWAIVVSRAWRDPRTRRLWTVAALVGLAIVAQAAALPYWILDWVSPSVDPFMRDYLLLYRPPPFHSLSIDPDSTLVAFALYSAMALLAVGLIRAMRVVGLEWLVLQVMGFGVALAVVGVVQKALVGTPDDFLVYGFWRPSQRGNPFGPFINRNHFAGWMVMALPLVVGYGCGVMARYGPSPDTNWRGLTRWAMSEEAGRPLHLATAVLIMGMALTLTGSRSGIAAFAIAMMVMTAFVVKRVPSLRVRKAAAAILLMLVVGAVAWSGLGATFERFSLASQDAGGRLSAWRDTLRIIGDFPLAGIGVGSYARAMLVYQTGIRASMYAHAHNEYLQMLAEGGLLVGVPIAGLIVLIVSGIRRRVALEEDDTLTTWIRAGAIAGLAGIAAQSLVEFSLQMPGNRVLFVVLLAIALHRPGNGQQVRRRRQA